MQAPTQRNARFIRGVKAFALALLAGYVFSSTSCESAGDTSGQGGGPCDTVYKGKCGATCTYDMDCPTGLYCESSQCTADCTAGSDCPDGACSDRGRCGGAGGAAGHGGGTGSFVTVGSGGHNGSGGQGGSCGEVDVSFAPQTPTVVLLIDQSGSMVQDFNGQTRWKTVYDVLMDPATGVVKGLQADVRFGLSLYTSNNGNSGGTCPVLTSVLPPAINNFDAMNTVYQPAAPIDDTPTGDAIAAITPGLAAFDKPGPKLIVLATDGEPDSCADPDDGDGMGKPKAIAAVQAAFMQSIQTVIIAVGTQVSQTHQQDMANAGAGKVVPAPANCDPMTDPMNCAQTYQPANKQAMIDAFNAIISGQRTCVFTLDGQVIEGKECDGKVYVNGMLLPCDDPNGWKLDSPTTIEFQGSACQTILGDPNVKIKATFPCDAASTGSGPPH